jgi:signal transduction histidine kinase
MVEDDIRAGSALRQRRKVLLFCAPVTLLFTFADTLALQRFSPGVFGLRLLWSGLIVATALALGRVSRAIEGWLTIGIAVASSAFFGLITALTGGYQSPLFHWILAMPLVIAVVLQEFPRATLGAALATIASGLAILVRDGQSPALCLQWAVQAAGMSALAVYASLTYRRLRFREQALREAAAVAGERAHAYERAVQARDEFLSIAGHELRTPMTALVINAERLTRRPDGNDAKRTEAIIESMRRQIHSLTTLVENVLDVSRLTSSDVALELRPTDVGAIADQVVQRYLSTAQQKGCTLELHRPGPVLAAVDGARFDQILTNVLVNAVKFGPGQPITVTVAAEAGRARVVVRDHGVGIAAADQQRIFERFERVATGTSAGGLGLGLWISRRLMEEMKGRILLESQPGKGATFTLDLPQAAPATHWPSASPRPS